MSNDVALLTRPPAPLEFRVDICLNLNINGVLVAPISIENDKYRFSVDDVSDPIRIRSLTAHPHLVNGTADARRLGVAISAIVIRNDDLTISISSQSSLLDDGFHATEHQFRWTNGNAAIPAHLLAAIGPGKVEIEIQIKKQLLPYATTSHVDLGNIALDVVGPTRGPGLSSADDHFEGIAYSSDGNILGVAAAGIDAVLLYHRGADGRFDPIPFRHFGGQGCDFKFFHDLVFINKMGREYLLAIERRGRVSIWLLDQGDHCSTDNFLGQIIIDLVSAVGASDNSNVFTDALAILPSGDGFHLAISEFVHNTVLFYDFELDSPSSARLVSTFTCRFITGPDGLAFSACGSWLAVTSHFNHTVYVFRREWTSDEAAPMFDQEPIAILGEAALMHPHSVVFCPSTNHLVATDSAGRCVFIFAFNGDTRQPRWSTRPMTTFEFTPANIFKEVQSKGFIREGGAKGVAIHGDEIALCSPEMGVQFYKVTPG